MKITMTRILPLFIAAVVTLHVQLRAQQPEPGAAPKTEATEVADAVEEAAVAEAADAAATSEESVVEAADVAETVQEDKATTQEPIRSPSDIDPNAGGDAEAKGDDAADEGAEGLSPSETIVLDQSCCAPVTCQTECCESQPKCRLKSLLGRGLLRRRCR